MSFAGSFCSQPAPTEHCLVVVGAGAVGKSSLTIQFVHKEFVSAYDPTIMEAYRKQDVVGHDVVMLDVVDTAGQADFLTIMHPYFRKGDGFLFVFSVDSAESLKQLMKLREEVLRVHDDATCVPAVLVGNKSDLVGPDREVPPYKDVVQKYAMNFFPAAPTAREAAVPYIETSAKNGVNVTEAFHTLVEEIRRRRRLRLGMGEDDNGPSIDEMASRFEERRDSGLTSSTLTTGNEQGSFKLRRQKSLSSSSSFAKRKKKLMGRCEIL
eukprot:PhM_4_TR7773/c0_g1_i1/m.97923